MSPNEAISLLEKGEPVCGVALTDVLDLRGRELIEPVILREVDLAADFRFAFFRAGFIAENCCFQGRVSFAEGGHNDEGSFVLRNCIFEDPVDFGDCLFTGPVEVTGCEFRKGTNLLGHEWAAVDQFRVPPQIERNKGILNLATV